MTTIADFTTALRREVVAEYEWAQRDPVQLDRFISRTTDALRTKRMAFVHDGPAVRRAWRSLGLKGRPTWKVLFTFTDDAPVTAP